MRGALSVDNRLHLLRGPRYAHPRGRFLETPRDQRCPSRLMACTEAAPCLGMEVLIKEHEVPPARASCVPRIAAVTRPIPLCVRHEETRQSRCQLLRDLAQRCHVSRARRTLDGERVAIEVVISFEGLDHEVVDGKPDRAAPVRVATENVGLRLTG